MFEKIILITRKTRLEELNMRYGSERQARFHIERGGGDFRQYAEEHTAYAASLESVRKELSRIEDLKVQRMDRDLVKSYLFSRRDLIVTLGQDGLVANTAKYVGDQPIVAVNPDVDRIDGILLPFRPEQVRAAVSRVVCGDAPVRRVTLAEAKLSDGQRLLAFNDLFIGVRTHVSARYRLQQGSRSENQSSSGVIVSTGAGATGWMSSILNMARAISGACGGSSGQAPHLEWEETRLLFAVREPFLSKSSGIDLSFGVIDPNQHLKIESQMPVDGVIFSDGIVADSLQFNSGLHVTIAPAAQRACLVMNPVGG